MSDENMSETKTSSVVEIGEASPQQVQELMQLHGTIPGLKVRIADLEIAKSEALVKFSQVNGAIQGIINDIRVTLNIPAEVRWDVRSDGKVVAFNIEAPADGGEGDDQE